MSRCIVANCFIQSRNQCKSPSDPTRLASWKSILNIEDEINEFNICAEHFDDNYLKIETTLTPRAFPTKFLTSVSNFNTDGTCQCCMKRNGPSEQKYPVDKLSKFQQMFKECTGCETQTFFSYGIVCEGCYEMVKKFSEFRSLIRKVQQNRLTIAKEQLKANERKRPRDKFPRVKLPTPVRVAQKQLALTETKQILISEVKEEDPVTISEAVIKKELVEEETEDSTLIKEEPLEDQIVTEGGASFVISEVKSGDVEPPQITGFGTVSRTPPINTYSYSKINIANWKVASPLVTPPVTIRRGPIRVASLANSLQSRVVMTNSNGQIKITQRQLNIMQAETGLESLSERNGIKCNFCPNYFVDVNFVNEHVKQKHTFVCVICNVIFPFKITLLKHQQSAHNSNCSDNLRGKFACIICNRKFYTEGLMHEHIQKYHKVVLINEKQDEKKAVKVGKKIIKKAEKKTLKCQTLKIHPPSHLKRVSPTQNFKLVTRTQTNVLIEKLMEQKKPLLIEDPDHGIPCLDCQKVFKPDDLLRHRVEAHDIKEGKKAYLCDLCEFETSTKSFLLHHMYAYHLNSKKLKCVSCSTAFSTKTELICHKNVYHNDNGTRFTCHFCYRIFNNKEDMQTHRKNHYIENLNGDKVPKNIRKKFEAYEPKGEAYKKIKRKGDD